MINIYNFISHFKYLVLFFGITFEGPMLMITSGFLFHQGFFDFTVPYQRTFADVEKEKPILLNDDFGRLELAINRGHFAYTFDVKRGDILTFVKTEET